ncbi:MAG: hypothetical protein NUV37_03190 [Nanoarchaeota archaeon]|nr:hypothetical protein [Nanoarchaeota archaeon]
MAKKTNPNKANQWRPDPRQSLFLQYYLDPNSETFSNALQSALKAGYEQYYAETITSKMPTWLAESVGDSKMIKQAEKNLEEFLTMDTVNQGTTKTGETFEYDDPRMKKIKSDVSQFVLERLYKKKYSQRNELTGKEGEDLKVELGLNKETKEILEELIRKRKAKV